jgi:hypothetical protein
MKETPQHEGQKRVEVVAYEVIVERKSGIKKATKDV